MSNPTIKNTIEGLGWYKDFLKGEDVAEPTKEQVIEWLYYAIEILDEFQDNPDVKRIYE